MARWTVRALFTLVAIGTPLFLLATSGCSLSSRPEFPLNLERRDPAKVSREQRQAIEETLAQLFGTPDEPRAPEGSGLDLALLKAAAGPVGSDAEGVQRGLFRQHCASCHGISGDGAGPAASMLSPYPRDFRLGVFKYTSTLPGIKPTRQDLELTLLRGAAGTAMPAFTQLRPEEVSALVEYVRYLAMRGETERCLVQMVVDEDESLPLDMETVKQEALDPVIDAWQAPERDPSLVVTVPPRPALRTPAERLASIARGKELFASKDAQCVKCHGASGKGDGEQSDLLYDDWNKLKQGATGAETAALAGRFPLPAQPIRPRDFTRGLFRGGSRPEDLYLRIYIGVKGTPMPGAGPAPGVKGVLKPEEVWDVVEYVRWLSQGWGK